MDDELIHNCGEAARTAGQELWDERRAHAAQYISFHGFHRVDGGWRDDRTPTI